MQLKKLENGLFFPFNKKKNIQTKLKFILGKNVGFQ